VTANSGAVFHQNDLKTPDMEIEAKTTEGKGYRITLAELESIEKKCVGNRIAVQVIEFRPSGKSFAILPLGELEVLLNKSK
jgi:hypothetical protein